MITAMLMPPAPTAGAPSVITNNAFSANWDTANGATGYRLDVSTNSTFASFVNGYQNLDVSNVFSRNVIGLSAGADYYYLVRAYNSSGTSTNSGAIAVKTVTSSMTINQESSHVVLSWPTNDHFTAGCQREIYDHERNDQQCEILSVKEIVAARTETFTESDLDWSVKSLQM